MLTQLPPQLTESLLHPEAASEKNVVGQSCQNLWLLTDGLLRVQAWQPLKSSLWFPQTATLQLLPRPNTTLPVLS